MYLERCDTSVPKHETRKIENELSHLIIGACIEVHRVLGGPGLLESIYEAALFHELTLKGLRVQKQKSVNVIYKGIVVKDPLFIDILLSMTESS